MVRGDFGRTTTQPLYRNRAAGLLGAGLGALAGL